MPLPIRFILALLSSSAICFAVPAQQPAPSSPSGPQTIQLDVVVTSKNGKPVSGLRQQNFVLFDNNTARPIASFDPAIAGQVPAEVVLVIDAVNTEYHNIAYEREQIDKFLKSNGGHLPYPVSLAIFTDTGTQLQQAPTTDGNALSADLDKAPIGLREIKRDSMYGGEDRSNLSISTLQSLIVKEAARPGRKLIFWLSPGWPALSGPNIELDTKQEQGIFSQIVAISTALRRNDITLYSIDPLGSGQSVGWEFYYQTFLDGVKKPNQVQLGDLALQVVAVQSGGLALSASNDIASQIQRCMDDVSTYYRISFDAPPGEQRDEYHRITVKVSQPGLTAHTRTGYYAEP